MDFDVLGVQEVEDVDTLQAVQPRRARRVVQHVVLIEGNDPRMIDVGLLSKFPLGAVISWQHIADPANPAQPVFSRDLLQVEVLKNDRKTRLVHGVRQPSEESLRPLGLAGQGSRSRTGERAAQAPVRDRSADHRGRDAARQPVSSSSAT